MVDPALPPLPSFWELQAPPDWREIDFISDLHLTAEMPRTFAAWAAHLRHTSADAVFILGDLFEVWVGDDARHEGFEAQCAEVLAETASRRAVAFMVGNRDFLVGGAMLSECGVTALPDPTVLVAFGERLMLSHGDALCLSDTVYQQFRSVVRNADWQAATLARPLSERRALARQLREKSEQSKADDADAPWFDVDPGAAVRWMHEAGTPTLIHGHTHRPCSEALAPGFTRHVLSDWDLDHGDPPRAQVLRLRRGGLTRMAPVGWTPA